MRWSLLPSSSSLGDAPFFAHVMAPSACLLSSFALASVVRMRSCVNSDETMFLRGEVRERACAICGELRNAMGVSGEPTNEVHEAPARALAGVRARAAHLNSAWRCAVLRLSLRSRILLFILPAYGVSVW